MATTLGKNFQGEGMRAPAAGEHVDSPTARLAQKPIPSSGRTLPRLPYPRPHTPRCKTPMELFDTHPCECGGGNFLLVDSTSDATL